jgi:hypothetical protein
MTTPPLTSSSTADIESAEGVLGTRGSEARILLEQSFEFALTPTEFQFQAWNLLANYLKAPSVHLRYR